MGYIGFAAVSYLFIGIVISLFVWHKANKKNNPLNSAEIFVSAVAWPATLAYIWEVKSQERKGGK